MKSDWRALKVTFIFYFLAFLFPVSILYTNTLINKNQEDDAIVKQVMQVQDAMHQISMLASTKVNKGVVQSVDQAIADVDQEKINTLAEYNPALQTLFKQTGDCWNNLKAGLPGLGEHKLAMTYGDQCWETAGYFRNAVLETVDIRQSRGLDGLYLTLFSSMILTIALIFIIRSQMKIQINKYSIYDTVTTLFNQHFFLTEIKKITSHAVRHGQPLSLLNLSVENFDAMTSKLGTKKRDKVLQTFGKLIRKSIREDDTGCRIDENEYTIILPDTDESHANMLVERLRKEIENLDCKLYREFSVTINIIQLQIDEETAQFVQRSRQRVGTLH